MSVFTWIINAVGRSRRVQVHRVALVEAGAEHDETIEIAVEDGVGGVAAAGIAENAERQRVILREHALGAQRGGDGNGPAFGQHPQPGGGDIVFDTSAGEESDAVRLAVR
jgi:hypothetical protein